MQCQKCKKEMVRKKDNYVQGWQCQNCGWNILTSDIDDISNKHNICIKAISNSNIDISAVKTIAKIANVNYLIAKKILLDGDFYIQNVSENEMEKLKKTNIPYELTH